ncbi:zinc-binding dehydrogenase [Streptomyces sp. NPDC006622]|uniref:zinc-binding dehydrogenase n=1 Tax=Streptomyces sp. NPDC006622 TaxID=3155459 RepID=UPI0033BFA744
MRAVQVKAFGGPEVLETADLPDPVPGPGEVLIEVDHVDTIFVETQIRAGWGREHFDTEPPYVPGGGVSGTVAAAGAGVADGWLGRRVAAFVRGGYAERATAAVTSLTPVPDGVDLRTAAALAHDGVTAQGLLGVTGVRADDRVLILGASGGMGTLLVQLAKARGARVVACARGGRKVALVRELGADAVVDVSAEDWPETARAALGGSGADVVLDGVGGELGALSFALAADGGRFSAHGAPTGGFAPVDPQEAKRRDVTLFGIADAQFGEADVRRLRTAALEEAAAGRLRVVVGRVFPLTEAAAAHRAVESRQPVGKVLLKA